MPRRCTAPTLAALLAAQDHLIHRQQALDAGLTAAAIKHRLATGQWRPLLAGVYLAQPGEASRRQLLIAASLYAGPDAAIDGPDACRFHGVKAVAVGDGLVYVAVPLASTARSRAFVVVRRSAPAISVVATERLRYVDAATAVISACRLMRQPRNVLAALSDAIQRDIATYDELVAAHQRGLPRNSRLTTEALETLSAGTLSVPEAEFRALVLTSNELPTVEYNVWLRLPGGHVVCVDALIESSALIHETNGRSAHQREDLFEDMQVRHDLLTTSGCTVLHNPPSRIRRDGAKVLAQFVACHRRYAGRGLPEGVQRISPPQRRAS